MKWTSLLFLGLLACSGSSGGNESAGAPAGASDAATGPTADAAAAPSDGEGPLAEWPVGPPPALTGPLTYSGQIQPVYRYWCTPCHAGDTVDGCAGGACFADFYEGTQFPAYSPDCASMVKAQCGMVRIRNSLPESDAEGKLVGPNDAIIVVDKKFRDVLDAWIAAGMPK